MLGITGLNKVVISLQKYLLLPELTTLLLSDNNIQVGIYKLFDLQFTSLRPLLCHYDFSYNNICPADPDDVYILDNTKLLIDHFVSLDLSNNGELDDTCMRRLLHNVWPLDRFNQLLSLQSLILHTCKLGDNSVHYLAETIRIGKLLFLSELDLSSNFITGIGGREIVDLIIDKRVLTLRILRLSQNNLGNDSIIAFAQVFYTGQFDYLEVLDMANVGANTDVMMLLGKQIVSRMASSSLKKLVWTGNLQGGMASATRTVRGVFKPDFLAKVKVS